MAGLRAAQEENNKNNQPKNNQKYTNKRVL